MPKTMPTADSGSVTTTQSGYERRQLDVASRVKPLHRDGHLRG
jgi:hypothetical protein